MRDHIIAAGIIAGGILIAGFLIGGRYEIVASQSNIIARLDRFSGRVDMCVPGVSRTGENCGIVMDPVSPEAAASETAPPCPDGAAKCKPWEREWPEGQSPQPGAIVTDDGHVRAPGAAR